MAVVDKTSLLTDALDLDSLPALPQTEIKVYICSNASDMQVEQSALMKTVYPNLREFCRRRSGMDFHALDARWSAPGWSRKSDDWLMYQSILDDCKRMSAGPNFVALIGQRLGDCLLPSFISSADFELVRQALTQSHGRHAKEAALLDPWYVRDDNMTSPAYILTTQNQNSRTSTPMSRILLLRSLSGSSSSRVNGQLQEPTWERTQCLLRQLLQKGIDLGLQTETVVSPFLVTDFERELQLGFHSAADQNNQCLAFFRTIVDLKNYVSLPVSLKFAEISCADGPDERPRLDEECQKRLTVVKDKITKQLPPKQSVTSSILWKYEDGINTRLHRDYLSNVCQQFQSKMEEMISQIPDSSTGSESWFDEVYQHWLIARDLIGQYIEREQILALVRSYAISSENKPLVIFGEAGTGKSTVLAKAAAEASVWVDGCETVSIIRFLGSTSQSLDIYQTLLSISRQILQATGRPPDGSPTSYLDLVNHFYQVLDSFPDDKCLVVFLDGVELLNPRYGAHIFDWLPQHIKENVKIVLSVTTGPILDTLRNDVIRRSNNFLQVPLLLPEECRTLLRAFLAGKNRKLTDEQESSVCENSFTYCATPLVVKMVADVVRRWSSTFEADLEALPDDVSVGIERVFEGLERWLGAGFVSRVLAVLTASLKGLSDCEMEDLLSMDDVAMVEVSEKSGSRDLGRIPPIAWQRIKYELQDLLRTVVCEGVTLVYWRHRAFADAARTRYLKDEKRRQEVHSMIASYWMGLKSSFENKPTNANIDDRLIPTQPLIFREQDSDNPNTIYNLRKFDQLPVHLSLSGRFDDLNSSVLFRFDWLYHKTRAFSLEHVICDYSLGKGIDVQLVESALRDAAHFINEDPNNMAAELTGRLLGYYNNHNNIRELIDECDQRGVEYCALVPNFPYRQMPGGALRHVVGCVDIPKECVIVGEEEEVLLTKNPASSFIQVIDLVTGERRGAIPTSVGSMYVSKSGRHAAVVDYAREKSVKLHSLETGKFLGHLIPVNHISLGTRDRQQLTHLCLSDTHLCMVICAESNWLCIADVTRCVMASVLNLPKRATVCLIAPDSRHVFVNAGTTLLSYDLDTMELANNTIFEEAPSQLYFTDDSRIGFVVGEQATRLMKITLTDGKIEFQVKIDMKASLPNDSIEDIQLSKSQELLLVRGHSNLVVYHLIDDRLMCHIERPNEVPTEFRLPKSSYSELKFTEARFAGDDKFLAAAIFRDVLIWQLGTGNNCRLVSTLRTPIGLIENLYATNFRGQLVTVSHRSNEIQIWSLQDSLGHVDALDRLTSPVDHIAITADDSKAFVSCSDSDEIGIIDMRTGSLVDLLTHESPVASFSISASGDFAFVAVKHAKSGQYNKIWNTVGRRVIDEFGNASAITVYCSESHSFLGLLQPVRGIREPFQLSMFKQSDEGAFEELKTDIEVSYVLQKPFLTPEEHYMALLSAEDFDHSKTHYVNPCICAVSLRTPIITMTTFTPTGLRDRVPSLRRILHIGPCPSNPYTVVVLYTNEPDPVNGKRSYEHNHGFLILDLCSAVICQLINDFFPPSTPLADVLFTRDIRLCIDHLSNVYDMANGHCLEKLHPGRERPCRLALRDAVVIYSDGQYLAVVRIADRKCLGRLSVHGDIRVVKVCHDDRTIVVGCADGSVVSHVLIDVDVDEKSEVIGQLATRKSRFFGGGGAPRFWDKVNTAPDYARPPSSVVGGGPTEKQRLQSLKPFATIRSTRPPSSSQLYDMSYGSQTCAIM